MVRNKMRKLLVLLLVQILLTVSDYLIIAPFLPRSARKSYLKSLDTIHHQGLRLALGAFRTSPVESLYAESNEPSLYIRREKLSLQYVTKLAANPRNSAYDPVFNPKYERFYNNKPTAIKPLGLRIQPLLEEANINIKNVQHFSFPSKEPWTLNPPKIILDLHKNKKTEVESHIFKNEFLEIKSNYKHYLSIYTDGSKQDEKVACSVISPNFTDSIRLPDNSSIFTAEAKAIDIALYHIRDQSEKQFIIYSDSLSVLKSLKDLHHTNPLIQQILKKYYYLSASKEIVFCWLPSHVNIRGNELADSEAKSALSLVITNFKIPHSDFKSNVCQYINNKCQSVWETQTYNKLNEIKPNFNSKCTFSNLSRKEQTKITRCRLGHTRITHHYILNNEQAPFCIPCNEPFTVKHFLITCAEFNHIRTKYFNIKTIKELFDMPTQKILEDLHHRNPLIQKILKKYYYLSASKEIVFCWLPSHVNIRGNELADSEAKSALSLVITNFKIPHSDFKSNVCQYINNKCQSVWETQTYNKLNEIKPNFNSKCTFSNLSRKEQTKITRCRLGHTRITHHYILNNEQAPFCIPCNEPFTVKHFLITCAEFNHIRTKYFNIKTIKELFDMPTQKILDFLKEIGLFNKI